MSVDYRALRSRQRPIVPQGFPCSIVGAGELNGRVREGNGCTLSATVTSFSAHTGVNYYNYYDVHGPQAVTFGTSASPERVETRGFEPLTLWMQTRCSPTELRPR